jgi:hypothetical protein
MRSVLIFSPHAKNLLENYTKYISPFSLLSDKPVISPNPLYSKSASDLRETARLVCEAKGVPNVTFAWMRIGGAYISASEIGYRDGSGEMRPKYQISRRVMDPLTATSEMLVFNVSNVDYGLYECVARNSEGKMTFLFARVGRNFWGQRERPNWLG